ncbi:branched-chain amino acid ABC transporter permease [Paenibacillus naphthalenovorans]|uniref:branched-chain amino acid ABC transporter permease n=1 Tax=Paenibacillus naphthalenovorans TaxID=162209 RepID=UPI003D2C8798
MTKKWVSWDLACLVLFISIAPFLLGESYFFETVNIAGIYAIAVIGLNLILGYAGLIALGHAGFFGLGAYVSAYLSIHLNVHPFLSILLSCILIAMFTFLITFPLLRLSGYFLALGTLGLGVVLFTLINSGGEITGGPNGLANIPGFSIGSYQFHSFHDHFYLIWITVLIIFILTKNLANSREGRAMKAIHSDEGAAASFGVNVFRFKMKVFVLGCTLGALAGGYYAHYMVFISPDIVSMHNSINMLIMGFLGGLGSYLGPITGTFVFQIIPQISALMEDYEILIKGIIFLLVVLFLPGGVQSAIDKVSLSLKGRKTTPKENRVYQESMGKE